MKTGQNSISSLGRTAPLSADEEARLTAAFQRTRDPAIGRRIAEANLRLVIATALKYKRSSSADLADLVQDGVVGLMEAVGRFDPGRGVRFATYALWWIRAFILKSLLDNTHVMRAGRSRADRKAFFNGQGPPAELSLDGTGNGEPLLDGLADGSALPADRALETLEQAAVLRGLAERFERRLPSREAAVFRERVLSEPAAPVRDLAERFSLSSERIRQIEKDLVHRFRPIAEAA